MRRSRLPTRGHDALIYRTLSPLQNGARLRRLSNQPPVGAVSLGAYRTENTFRPFSSPSLDRHQRLRVRCDTLLIYHHGPHFIQSSVSRLRPRCPARPLRLRRRGAGTYRPHWAEWHRQVVHAQNHRQVREAPTTVRCNANLAFKSLTLRKSPY